MNPVNATALYISASRLVLNYDPEDPKAFTEIIRILPYLRQSLSCCVCGHLLQDPIASTNSTCQHYVCKTCKGKKMMIKPSCSWCKDYEQYEENKQLSILVNCYKKLCEYITQITLVQDIREGVDYYSDMLALLREGSLFFEETEKSSDSSFTLCLTHSPVPTTLEPIADPQANLSPKDESALNTAIGSSVVNGLPTCNGLPIDRFAINIASPEHQNMIEMCNTVDMKTDYLSDSLPHVCDMVTTDLCSTGIDICNFSEDPKPGDSLLLSVEELLHSLETVSIIEDGCPNLHPNMEATVFNEPILQLSSQSLSQNDFTSTSPTLHGLSSTAATAKVAKLNRKRSRSESDSDKVQPLPISTIIRDPTLGVSAPVTVKHERKISLQATASVSNGRKTPKISKTVPLSAKSMKKSHEHGSKKSPFKSKSGILKKDKALKEKSFSHHFMAGNPNKSVYKKPQGKKGCKCGRAMQNQSVLTCCSQRCSCYSNRKACLDCRCCGCQNSYMANGKKKLEAFAVPEKALEQSRLTFGVNVTSDSMCNASTRTSAINVIGSPGMTFLAASTHDNKSLNEAIDMRFGC